MLNKPTTWLLLTPIPLAWLALGISPSSERREPIIDADKQALPRLVMAAPESHSALDSRGTDEASFNGRQQAVPPWHDRSNRAGDFTATTPTTAFKAEAKPSIAADERPAFPAEVEAAHQRFRNCMLNQGYEKVSLELLVYWFFDRGGETIKNPKEQALLDASDLCREFLVVDFADM